MKNLKYVKLFESFVNEELSPELQKRAYDAMIKIARDPDALDRKIKGGQAKNIESMLAPSVKSTLENLKSVVSKFALANNVALDVQVSDDGMSEGMVVIHVGYPDSDGGFVATRSVHGYFQSIFKVLVSKDKYQRFSNFSGNDPEAEVVYDHLEKDRGFIISLKKLIVEIQKNEIPGELEVPAQPQSVTPEGSIILFPLT